MLRQYKKNYNDLILILATVLLPIDLVGKAPDENP